MPIIRHVKSSAFSPSVTRVRQFQFAEVAMANVLVIRSQTSCLWIKLERHVLPVREFDELLTG